MTGGKGREEVVWYGMEWVDGERDGVKEVC